MKSPKGKYRLKGMLVTGIIFLILVALSGGFDNYGQWHIELAMNPNGWIFKQLNNIAEIFIGLFILYVAHRTINHKRTHEFNNSHQHSLIITCTWIIAIAFVIGNALN